MSVRDEPLTLFVGRLDRLGQVRGTPPVSLVAYWAVDREALEEATIDKPGTLSTGDEAALGNGNTSEPNAGIETEEDVESEGYVAGEKAFFRIVAR